MCKAHVLRFCCGHGVLMSVEPCNVGPCPIIRPTGTRLPQQPFKCYSCERRLSRTNTGLSSTSNASCSSSVGSSDSDSPPSSPTERSGLAVMNKIMAPLPCVAVQPAASVQYGRRSLSRTESSSGRRFSFACCSSDHHTTPHYANLPTFLPHQDHPCPPCQIEGLRCKADQEITAEAAAEFPHLKGEMLVRNGRIREEWQSKVSLEQYVDGRREEEKQMWLHVARKWTQDLKRARVLVAEEDGLGLLFV